MENLESTVFCSCLQGRERHLSLTSLSLYSLSLQPDEAFSFSSLLSCPLLQHFDWSNPHLQFSSVFITSITFYFRLCLPPWFSLHYCRYPPLFLCPLSCQTLLCVHTTQSKSENSIRSLSTLNNRRMLKSTSGQQ